MSITVAQLRDLTTSPEKPFVVDVRSSGEFAVGHIPCAAHIPMEEAEVRLGDIPTDRKVVLVCHSGDRASMTCELIRHARPNAEVLEGGTEAWIAAGLPTVCSRSVRWSIERQVRLTAGLLIIAGVLLSLFIAPGWVYVALFIGLGLTFAGLTNFCGMAALYAQMPWNKPKKSSSTELKAGATNP